MEREVREYSPAVAKLAHWASTKHLAKHNPDPDDLYQTAMVRLLEHGPFHPDDWDAVRADLLNAMRNYARQNCTLIRDASGDFVAPVDVDEVELTGRPGVDEAERLALKDWARNLPVRERIVVMMTAYGETREEIAWALGVTVQRVGQLEQQAKNRLTL